MNHSRDTGSEQDSDMKNDVKSTISTKSKKKGSFQTVESTKASYTSCSVIRDDEAPPRSEVSSLSESTKHRDSVTLSDEQKQRSSSLEMRKLPVNVLLMPDRPSFDRSSFSILSRKDTDGTKRRGLFRMTCLNPKFELRTQLMTSFGTVSFITILVVIIICVSVSLSTGDSIKEINSRTFQSLANQAQGRTARYLAESLEHRLIPKDVVQIVYEATRDRFQGFPRFTDDSQVPFTNMDTGNSVYPVVGNPLPLDWDLEDSVTEANQAEHFQGRRQWYGDFPISSANGNLVMQGACDPSETDPQSMTYWENCSDANNDITTGGILRPSNLTLPIYEKASDLVPVMKALYESNQDVRDISLCFANQGVGATVSFPHYPLDTQNTYVSAGCDWMAEPNPYDPSRPIGTQEEIDQCYKEGEEVSSREYNPLVRAWCRNQALNPEKVLVEGPYRDAWNNNWFLSSGRAVYDRLTNDFVACIFVGLTTAFAEDILKNSTVTPNSEVSVVRFDPDGIVLASSAISLSGQVNSTNIVELTLGLTEETYKELYGLVNYTADWDPVAVQQAYEEFQAHADGFVVAAYPIPPIPEEFDPSYEPDFFAVTSTAEADVFDKVNDVNEELDDRVHNSIMFAVLVGSLGFVVVILIILVTSTAITRPLQLMNRDAKKIVGSFGDDSLETKQIMPIDMKFSRCVPNTEITDVVKEFNKMVSSFSGSLMARSEAGNYDEVLNTFDLPEPLMALYASPTKSTLLQKSNDLARDFSSPSDVIREKGSSAGGGDKPPAIESHPADSVETVTKGTAEKFLNYGTNLKSPKPSDKRVISSRDLPGNPRNRCASPLFLWIVILIVTPLLLTTITISVVVISTMNNEFDESVQDAKAHFLDVAIKALTVYEGLRATFVRIDTERSVRDLFLLTRYASWLLFDGLQRADSFTEVMSEVNECKADDSADTCQWVLDNHVCGCSWHRADDECTHFSEIESRRRQVPYFAVSSDAAEPNGTRLSTNFPNNSFSPESTQWWDGPYDLPGSDENDTAFGYATTYDRLRVISALPVLHVLSNYDPTMENSMGHFIAFEEDGLFIANEGCWNTAHAWVAFWQSSAVNGAYKLRPELCPLDKYGFDPRCREWYNTGRKIATSQTVPLYITAPYENADSSSATSASFAQSATAALVDPRTGFYVGQSLLDFALNKVFNVLSGSRTPLSMGGFPLLITIGNDTFGGDTVIGPGFNASVAAKPVTDVVMGSLDECREDEGCVVRYNAFQSVVRRMKAGHTATESFEKANEDGEVETVYLAYAPIIVKYPEPVDSSDFARGSNLSDHLVFSLGLAETEKGLLEPFTEIEDDMERHITIAIAILSVVIFAAVIAAIYISYLVACSILEHLTFLLDVLRSLNSQDWDQDPPEVDSTVGSKEIVIVSKTIESLYRVVRLANVSFYVGDLEAAYRVLVDALRLFKRLDNKKAIGIACNNLGNTMLAIYRAMQVEKADSMYGIARRDAIVGGTAYFHEAIVVGEEAYDKFFEVEGWSPTCLDFMQHLAGRYFNRAIFLLTIKDDHEHPKEIETLGFRDLGIARDMDCEIETQGEESGWGAVNRVEKLFNVRLSRIQGHLLLVEMGYSDDWEIEEHLDDLFSMLEVERKKSQSDLFNDMSYTGRLQQAETERMKYYQSQGDLKMAAQIAMRMVVEDEYIIYNAEAEAIKVLQDYLKSNKHELEPELAAKCSSSLEEMLRDLAECYESKRDQIAASRLHSIASKSLRNFSGDMPGTSTRAWSMTLRYGQIVTMEQF